MTIITDPLFYILAVPGVIALGLSKGGFAGVGQMATPLLAVTMPPLEAAAIMLPIMIVQDATAMWVYRKGWNRRVLAIMMPGAIVGIGAAWFVASFISDNAVRVFIAVITIAFCIYNWVGPRRIADAAAAPGRLPVAGGVFWASLSGFCSTICQAGGPPYHIQVMQLKLPKMMYVSTGAIFFGTMNFMKVVPYFALGQFSATGLATSTALLPLAIAANMFGFWVVRRTPDKLFFQITLIMLFAISLALLWQGGRGMLGI
ncbi:MAG: sulfite exporter TauE/SafE family protein [Pseudolabrys sp.]